MINFKRLTNEQLGEAYKEIVGYNPWEDDASIQREEVISIIVSYDVEAAESGDPPFEQYFFSDEVQYLTREHIIGEAAVKEFLSGVILNLDIGMGFHPDTPFEEYIFKIGDKKDERLFTDEQSVELNKSLNECFEECSKAGLDIYGICLDILEPTLKQAFGEDYGKD